MCRGMFEKGMWAHVDQNLSDVSMLEDSMNCEIWSKGDWWIVCEMLLVLLLPSATLASATLASLLMPGSNPWPFLSS